MPTVFALCRFFNETNTVRFGNRSTVIEQLAHPPFSRLLPYPFFVLLGSEIDCWIRSVAYECFELAVWQSVEPTATQLCHPYWTRCKNYQIFDTDFWC